MRCASCGTENPASARFCVGCGLTLQTVCAACGTAVPASGRFCPQCGTAVAAGIAPRAEASPAPSPGPAGSQQGAVSERRLCSILFVDLVGFTPLSASKDPEEVREILSRYFDVARRTVSRYGGIVEKFIGDAVMAVWGTPIAEEGDTERAVRAALDLVDAVEVLGAQLGATGLSARAGVVTGEVAVTLGAQGEGMVAGDAVNTASRVQAVARPGSVLVDDATRRLSAAAIAFTDEGAFELKGKAQPEQLYSATRVVSGVGGNRSVEGLEAPFTGRDAELRGVKDLFHASVERRTPRLVVVTGPAGVGKSRLGWEFEKYIDGLADTVLWHRGRCLSYGEGVAFWALAEIVRQRFGIAEEDTNELATSKLHEGLVRFVADDNEREYVGVRLSRLLGVPYASGTKVVLSQDELYAGWRLFFEHLAKVAPVTLLVEDAQHADDSLLGFLAHLIDWTRDLPIFVLLFARPGHPAIDAGYGIGRNRSTLSFDPLDTASMDELVGALVPGMPDDARDAITARAQGIPLFAVETVRSLIDQGIVQRAGEGYHLAGDLGTLRVPDSLHALLAARLDALPPGVRAIVADASVVGTSFPQEALVAVSGQPDEAVAEALAELVRRDVLQVLADPLSPERGAFRFSQEMLRQVAYDTLSRRDRKSRHLAAARHMRTAFPNDGEEIADAIARHYLDALAAAPTDGDAEDIKGAALDFLVRAAQRSARSGAPARAAQLYTQAAAIAPPDRSALLLEEAAIAGVDAGDRRSALDHAQAARAAHLELGDRRGAARAQSMEAHILQQLGRHGAARQAVTEALEVLGQDPDADTVTALRHLATLEAHSGEAAEGRRVVTDALDLAQALGVSTQDLAALFTTRGVAGGFAGRLVEAACDLREAARLAERAGDVGAIGRAQLNAANVLVQSDPRAAADLARSAVAHARRTGRRAVLGSAVGNLAIVLLDLGEWDEVDAVLREFREVDHLDQFEVEGMAGWLAALRADSTRTAEVLEAVEPYRTSEDPQDLALMGSLDAMAAQLAGDASGALVHASGVLERSGAVGIGSEMVRWCWPLAARAARALGDRDAIERLVTMLESRPVGHVPPILRAERQLTVALLAADAAGADHRALEALADAVEAMREPGNPYQLAHALVDWAEVVARPGAGDVEGMDGASEALAEAVAIADRLRCPPLRARADRVVSRWAGASAPN